MWAKAAQYFIKFMQSPLGKYLGAQLIKQFINFVNAKCEQYQKRYEAWKRNKKIDQNTERMENAESPEDIRAAHRDREHF